jgi:hypothetical protein
MTVKLLFNIDPAAAVETDEAPRGAIERGDLLS